MIYHKPPQNTLIDVDTDFYLKMAILLGEEDVSVCQETHTKNFVSCLELLIIKMHNVIGDKHIGNKNMYLFNYQVFEKTTEIILKPNKSKLHFEN